MAYGYYRSITVDHTQCGSSNSANFGVLVSISGAASVKTVANGGRIHNTVVQSGGAAITIPADLVFSSDSAGTSLYAWEVEYYDAVAGDLICWVRLPIISNTVDSVFYVAYGDAGVVTQQNVGSFAVVNVWDGSYLGIWHLSSVAAIKDSTANANHGTNNNSVTAVPGKIDGGAHTENTGSYISTSNVINVTKVTISAWVNLPLYSSGYGLVAGCMNGAGSAIFDKDLSVDNLGRPTFYAYDGSQRLVTSASPIGLDEWVYLVGTADGSNLQVYVNGSLLASTGSFDTYSNYTTPNFFINGNTGGAFPNQVYATENLDEVRISNGARSANWILAEYNNQFAPGNIGTPGFLTFGSEVNNFPTTGANLEDRILAGMEFAITPRETSIGGFN